MPSIWLDPIEVSLRTLSKHPLCKHNQCQNTFRRCNEEKKNTYKSIKLPIEQVGDGKQHWPALGCSILAGTSHRWRQGTRRPAQQACAWAALRLWGPAPGSSRPPSYGSCMLSVQHTGPLACIKYRTNIISFDGLHISLSLRYSHRCK